MLVLKILNSFRLLPPTISPLPSQYLLHSPPSHHQSTSNTIMQSHSSQGQHTPTVTNTIMQSLNILHSISQYSTGARQFHHPITSLLQSLSTAAVCWPPKDTILSQFHPLSLQVQHIIILSFTLLLFRRLHTTAVYDSHAQSRDNTCTCPRSSALRFQTPVALLSR